MLAAARSRAQTAGGGSSPLGTETFSLQLYHAVPTAELRAWFDGAGAGHRAIYATGALLPTEAEGVKLVTRWKDAGLVRTFRKRDPANGRQWQFLIEKVGPSASQGSGSVVPNRRRALPPLRAAPQRARRGRTCGGCCPNCAAWPSAGCHARATPNGRSCWGWAAANAAGHGEVPAGAADRRTRDRGGRPRHLRPAQGDDPGPRTREREGDGMMLDPADRLLLASVRTALEVPFRDPVRVGGVLVPRKLARQIERNLARLKLAGRREVR